MAKTDARVDAYIEKAAPFAKPILVKLRKLIYQACPDVEETIKWSFPNYEIYGSMLCSMASFKYVRWILESVPAKGFEGILHWRIEMQWGHRQAWFIKGLPADKILIAYLKEAAMLNKNKVKVVKPKSAPKRVAHSQTLAAALKKIKSTGRFCEIFSFPAT
jgi:hypothetical protein